MKKTLVILLGPHAVGKMTVGQELAKITGLRLFHNHMSIELARKLFAHAEKEWHILNETIRQTVFELRRTSETYRLNAYDRECLPFEHYMKIDNTCIPPDAAAKMIQTHFAIGEHQSQKA